MRILVRLFLVFLLLAAIASGYLIYRLEQPYQGFQGEKTIELPMGTSTEEIAAVLQGAGVIRSSWEFVAARILSPGAKLQAGEYVFRKPASTFQVFKRIARGDIFYYELVVPEGNNMFDIAASVQRLGIFNEEKFLVAARNPAMIRDLDANAPSLEGYLFPDTYRVNRRTTPEQLCRSMTGKFRNVWRTIASGADAHKTVTLASLVEKEAKLQRERPTIASVFRNRLNIGMKLDCDPTTIYAALLEGRYRGTIHKSDLESDNPYNTYRKSGLPPGPIANPGMSSLQAALQPNDTRFLYFVAKPDGSGGHTFSENLASHSQATAEYRRGAQQ